MLFADAWLAGKWAERAGPPEFHRSRMSPVLAVLSVSQQPNHLEVADRWQCVWPVPEMSWTYRSTWGKPRHVVSVNLGESVNFSRSRGQNMSSGSSQLDYRSTWGESPFRYRSTWGNTGTAVSVNLGGKRPKLSVNLGGKQCIPIGQLGGKTALNLVTDVYRAVLLLLLQQFFYSFQQIKRTTTQRRSG